MRGRFLLDEKKEEMGVDKRIRNKNIIDEYRKVSPEEKYMTCRPFLLLLRSEKNNEKWAEKRMSYKKKHVL